jgi:hypothetical protein
MCTVKAATSIDGKSRAALRTIRDMQLYLSDFLRDVFIAPATVIRGMLSARPVLV